MNIDRNATAIVTGGSSGLGAAVARELSRCGARVGILDTDVDAGKALASEIGGLFARCDVGEQESVASAVSAVRSAFGQERICANCAGIAVFQPTLHKGGLHDLALFERIVRVNLIGSFNVGSQSAAGMASSQPVGDDRERGIIINTASIAALDGPAGYAAYSASKAGVTGMTLPMARDLSRDGIRVVAIAPGIFSTPMSADIPDDLQRSVAEELPFPSRFGDPAEFAALVIHCIENPMLNGETIRIDGAWRMTPT